MNKVKIPSAGEKITMNNIYIKRDLIYVSDLVEAIIKSFLLRSKFEILNIGSGKSYEIKKVINVLQKINKTHFRVKNKGINKLNEILTTRLDIKKAKNILKWKPLHSLEAGLRNTIYNRKL